MRTRTVAALLAALALLAACGRATRDVFTTVNDSMSASPAEAPAAPVAMEMARAAGDKAVAGQAAPPAAGQAPANVDALKGRKIIYTGSVTMEVKDLDASLATLREVVAKSGGYISNLTQLGAGTTRSAEITVRLPAERFLAAVDELCELGQVEQRSLSTEDVSEQWIDLDARVRNLKREEERLLELLAKAGKVSELLEVERELARVRGEAEQIEAQLRHLNDRVSLSTITVSLHLPAEVAAAAESGPWFLRVLSRATATFVVIGKHLIELLTFVVVLSPYVGLLALLFWLPGRRRRRVS